MVDYVDYRTILSKRVSGGAGWRIYIGQTVGGLVFQTYDTALAQISSGATGIPAIEEWAHVVLVRSGAAGYIYLNGELVGSGTTKSGSLDTTEDFFVGMYANIQLMKGLVDKVKYFNKALTLSEVKDLREQEMAGRL